MNVAWLVAASLVVLATWSLSPSRAEAGRRLARVLPADVAPIAPRRTPHARAPSAALRVGGAAGAGGLVAVVLDAGSSPLRLLATTAVGAASWWLLGRLEPAAQRRTRERVLRDLPFAVDLFASCVAAGAPAHTGLRLAGEGVTGPVGDAFVAASAALGLGAPAADAVNPWRADRALEPLEPLARVLVRSATSGVALVPAAARLAAELRDARKWQIDAAARRVGVRAAAPLGVCFLPAFVLLGIAPVVVAGARGFGW